MTEINTTPRASQQSAQPSQQSQQLQALQQRQEQQRQFTEARGENRSTNAAANRMTGLGSGINSDQVIQQIVQVERRRLEPVEDSRFTTLQELESFALINQGLENINGTIDALKSNATWEGKIVESSNEDVVTATATRGAKPGKNTLVVDRLALNHQIASQNYETPEEIVGKGRFEITVGEGNPITVVVDDTNNTLTGLKDAINFATDEVNATIIKTGNKTKPYQLVLTSQMTGSEGRILLEVNLRDGEIPNFDNFVEDPSAWQGVGEPAVDKAPPLIGTGASTAIVKIVGEYTGEDENTYTFSSVQNGIVGGENQLQMRWTDEEGRSGNINLDKLNYAPGEPIEFVDGLALIFSEGEIIVNDSFTFTANPERPNRFWWIDAEGRKANVSTPTAWNRQLTAEFGTPVIDGKYTGEDDQEFILTVQGGGQVGRSSNLSIRWEDEDGISGILNVGQGYEPGSPMALSQGLTLALKPGVLTDGQLATFEVEAEDRTSKWWLPDEERIIPPVVVDVTNWALPDVEEGEVAGFMPDLPIEAGQRVSTTEVTLSGVFVGDEAKVYTFTALSDGAIGTSKGVRIKWEDDSGNFGELIVDQSYQTGTPLPFDSGLSIAFGPGRVFETDFFTVRTRTASIQPPQDALIRFGASEFGGGLEITSSTNEVEGVIDGVRLNLVSTSEKPVTITVRGDKEQAREVVLDFVDQFNQLSLLITELTKFDQDSEVASPLLGNSDVANIRNRMSQLVMDPVAGLPRSTNMLFAIGISLDNQGLLVVDETKLNNKIDEDFGIFADLFRDKGESDNNQVAYLGMTDQTAINPDGYTVDITRPATQGFYQSPALPPSVVIDQTNNLFSVSVDGRQSEQLELPVGNYTISAYARLLQNAIAGDDIIGQRGVRVVAEGDTIRAISSRFGSNSNITFVPGESSAAGVGLLQGQSVQGLNVEGTIDGNPAKGNGQLLSAPEGSGPSSGLRVFTKVSEPQLNPTGPEATIAITKGVASRVSTYLKTLVDPLSGQMRRITKNLRDRVGNLDDQLEKMEERIESKRQRLQRKFQRMETQLSRLRGQQTFMQGQLGGGGGALPGLPQ